MRMTQENKKIEKFIKETSDNIATFLEPYISSIEDKYTWDFNIETAHILLEYNFEAETNAYQRTLKLKSLLTEKIQTNQSFDGSYSFGEYFVKDWGGVRTNKSLKEKLTPFYDLKGKRLEQVNLPNKLDSVSSWSKYLSLLCDWAAIYDSRVAYSINAINYIAGNRSLFFPMPDGRSPRLNIVDIESLFVLDKIKNNDSFITDKDFNHRQIASRLKKRYYLQEESTYKTYLNLVYQVAVKLDLNPDEHFKIEMLLFALAPNEVFIALIGSLKKSKELTG